MQAAMTLLYRVMRDLGDGMPTTTPSTISAEILQFCAMISPEPPVMLPVHPAPYSLLSECFNNVDAVLADYGGERILGWLIWERAGAFIECEHHAIWKDEHGNLIDITPHADGEAQILFLRDDSAVPLPTTGLPNRMKATSRSLTVKRYVEIANQFRMTDWKVRSTGAPPSGREAGEARKLAIKFMAAQARLDAKFP